MQLDTVLLDIGCGNGQRAARWCEQHRDAMVYAFEPLHEAFERASAHHAAGRLHVFKAAITATPTAPPTTAATATATTTTTTTTTTILYVANDTSSSSTLPFANALKQWRYPPGRLAFQTLETRIVPAMRIDTFLGTRRITRVAFARIETQGNALDVLRAFGKRLRDVDEIVVKVHVVDFDVYEGQTRKPELVEWMRRNGFHVHATRKYSRDQEEFIWFVNGKALRSPKLLHLDLEK